VTIAILEYTRTDFTIAPSIDRVALAVLRAQLPGRVLLPGEAGYDEARAGFNIGNLPTPDVVVLATSAADVVAAVDFARDQQLATGGVLPSWLGDGDHGVERARAGFTAGRYARPMQLKDVYDPDNLFRLSANYIPGTRSLVVVP